MDDIYLTPAEYEAFIVGPELQAANARLGFDRRGDWLVVTVSTHPGRRWLVDAREFARIRAAETGTVADVSAGTADGRALPEVESPTRKLFGTSADVTIEAPGEPDEQWHIGSTNLVSEWGLEHGPQADSVVALMLDEHAPHLATVIDFDSYEDIFSAYVDTRDLAEELAALLRSSS